MYPCRRVLPSPTRPNQLSCNSDLDKEVLNYSCSYILTQRTSCVDLRILNYNQLRRRRSLWEFRGNLKVKCADTIIMQDVV